MPAALSAAAIAAEGEAECCSGDGLGLGECGTRLACSGCPVVPWALPGLAPAVFWSALVTGEGVDCLRTGAAAVVGDVPDSATWPALGAAAAALPAAAAESDSAALPAAALPAAALPAAALPCTLTSLAPIPDAQACSRAAAALARVGDAWR